MTGARGATTSACVCAVLPALDEEGAIGGVVRGIAPFVDRVVVVDNGSTDGTARVAREAGADVVSEPRRGYGRAMLAGLARARELGADVLLFLDADGSDVPEEAPLLVDPVRAGDVDLTLGVRRRPAKGAMTPVQRFGNWLAPLAMRAAIGARYTDMPPYKALSRAAIDRLDLTDTGHGFTIQLMLQAHARGLRVREVDVTCRPRVAGESKVSGTLRGTVRAGAKILYLVARHGAEARRTSRHA